MASFIYIFKSNKRTFFLFFGIFVLGLFIRLYNLNLLPIFGDEAIYIRWSQVMRVEPSLRFLPLSDGKQPIFMWAIIPFLKIYSDPLTAGRLVSVLTGIGTLIGVFVLTQILFKNQKISLLASLIYAISPYSLFFDRMALADSMLSFFGVWTLIFSAITVMKTRLDTAMLAGFFLGGALLTKSPAVFFVLLIPLTLIFANWSGGLKKHFDKISVYVFLFTFTYLIGYGIYNVLRLGENFHMISIRNQDYVYNFSHFFSSPLNPFLPHLKDIIDYFWLMGPSFLLFLILFGVIIAWKNYKKETILLMSWGIIPILVSSEFSKTMTARYIFFSLPYLIIIASVSLGLKLSSLLPKSNFRLESVLKFAVIMFIIHAIYIDLQLLTYPQRAKLPRSERSGYMEEWTSGYGITEVSEYIREKYTELKGQEKIVVGTEGYFGTLPDGLQIYLNNIPEITVVGVGLDIKELPQSLVESRDAGNRTYLVINDSRLIANPDNLDLKLIAVYPKAFRKEGTREYNTLGPRESLYLFEVIKKPS